MALSPLTLSVTAGLQGRPFQARILGLSAGSRVTIGHDASPGFSAVNGLLMSSSLPYPVSTVAIIETLPGVGRLETRININAVEPYALSVQALNSLVPGRDLVRFTTGYAVLPDGSMVYTLYVEDSAGVTTPLVPGGPLLPNPLTTYANSTIVYANTAGFYAPLLGVQQRLAALGVPFSSVNFGTGPNTNTGDSIYVALVKLQNGIAAAETTSSNRQFFTDPFFADGMFARS